MQSQRSQLGGDRRVRVIEGDVTTEAEFKREKGRFEDTALLTLRTDKGAMSQGMQAASRSLKRQGRVSLRV